MNRFVLTIILALVSMTALIGCETQADRDKQAAAQQNLQATIKSVTDDAQWKLDDEFATHVFENDANSVSNYMTFRKCHEEPPTHEANKKVCAALMARVRKAEAKAEAKTASDKAKW